MTTKFTNPLNPLDLNLNNLNEIRTKFIELQETQGNNYKGIKVENLALLLSQYLKCEPSKMTKIIQRNSILDYIDWNHFLSILDIEAGVREKLLELEMFDLKLRRFVSYENKILKPENRQTDRLYYIQKVLPIEFQGKQLLLLVFDDSTIAFFHYNSFQHETEFKVNFEFSIEMFINHQGLANKLNRYQKPTVTQQQSPQKPQTSYNVHNTEFQIQQETPLFDIKEFDPSYGIIEECIPNYGRIKKNRIIALVLKFLSKLKESWQKKKSKQKRNNFSSHQNKRRVMSFEDEKYLEKNKDHIHKVFQIFKLVPDEQSAQFCESINKRINQKKLESIHQSKLAQTIKSLKKQPQKNDKKQDYTQFGNYNPVQKAEEMKQMISEFRKELQQVGKLVDIDLNNLNQKDDKQSTSFINYLPTSSAKKTEKGLKMKKKSLFVTSLAYCQETCLMFLGFVNQELQVYSMLGGDRGKFLNLRRVFQMKMMEIIKFMYCHKHSICNQNHLIALFNKNTIRIFAYNYNQKLNLFNLDHQGVQTLDLKFEINIMKYYAQLGTIQSSLTGEFMVMADHCQVMPATKQPFKKDKFYYQILRKQLHLKSNISISNFSYSEYHKLIFFGSLDGRVVFFSLFANEIVHISCINDSGPIIDMVTFEQQDQIIVIHTSYIINVWDINQKKLIQSFKTIENRKENLQYQLNSCAFIESKRTLIAVGSSVQSWIGIVDQDLQFQKNKLEAIGYFRDRKVDKESKPRKDLSMILTKEEHSTKVGENIWVKPKRPDPQVSLVFVMKSKDYIVLFFSNKQFHLYQQLTLKLSHMFLLDIEESIENILSMSINEDNKLLGFITHKGELKIFNMFSQELLQNLDLKLSLNHFFFLPSNSEYFYTVIYDESFLQFQISNLKPGKKLKNKDFQTHKKPIVAFDKDSTNLITISDDLHICIFHLISCSLKKQLDLLLELSIKPTIQFCRIFLPSEASIIFQNGDFFTLNLLDGSIYQSKKKLFSQNTLVAGMDGFGSTMISVDETLTMKFFGLFNEDDDKRFQNPPTSQQIIQSKSILISKRRSLMTRAKFLKQSDEVGWIKIREINLDKEKDWEMIPKEVLYLNSGMFMIAFSQQLLILINSEGDLVSKVEYKTGNLTNNSSNRLPSQIVDTEMGRSMQI